jgi:hypothetical protein
MKPGLHKLKVSFKPKGASKASVKTLKIRFTGAKARKSGIAVAHTPFRSD